MLCNSEFLLILGLKENERHILEDELEISPNLMRYITSPPVGCGLLKFGDRVIPLDGRIPKDSEMYRLANTNFHELAGIRKRALKKEVRQTGQLSKEMLRTDPTEGEMIMR